MVIYKKWGGNDVEIGGKKYYLLRFEEIIAVVE
jgi:co-chaperonin GroES (HSP10)